MHTFSDIDSLSILVVRCSCIGREAVLAAAVLPPSTNTLSDFLLLARSQRSLMPLNSRNQSVTNTARTKAKKQRNPAKIHVIIGHDLGVYVFDCMLIVDVVAPGHCR